MSARWAGLSQRERAIVAGGAIVVMLLVLWLFVVQPLTSARDRLRSALPSLRAQAAQVAAGAEEVKKLRTAGARSATSGDPVAGVLETAEAAGLKDRIRSVSPTSDTVAVSLEPVAYPRLVRWLGDLAQGRGLVVAAFGARVPENGAALEVETLSLRIPGTSVSPIGASRPLTRAN